MLFPKEEEYIEWFQKAGFKDVQLKRIGQKWYRGVRRHGLIMGCSVTGVKPASGDSPLQVFVILASQSISFVDVFHCFLWGVFIVFHFKWNQRQSAYVCIYLLVSVCPFV